MSEITKTADRLYRELWNTPLRVRYKPKPKYKKGDTSAARARLKKLREAEAPLRVPRELITPDSVLLAKYEIAAQPVPVPFGEQPRKVQTRQDCWDAPRRVLDVLPAGGCQYPIGDPGTRGFRFCEKDRSHGSYCARHASICYRRGKSDDRC